MTLSSTQRRLRTIGPAAVLVLALSANAAFAGGFAIREQSASSQGASFAGSAAGGDLSSMFWNPAAAGALSGTNTESHYSLILPDSSLSNGALTGPAVPAVPALATLDTQTDIGRFAALSATYLNYQLAPGAYLGLSITAPFGLVTKPENTNWVGFMHGRRAQIFTLNVNAVAAFQVAPGITIGAGPMFQHMRATLKFAPAPVPGIGSSVIRASHNIGLGYTAGILFERGGTSLGIGFRSNVEQHLTGAFFVTDTLIRTAARVDLETPETVTASLRHEMLPGLRLLGTVEWTNWSRLKTVVVRDRNNLFVATGGVITTLPLNWDDGWFFSGGLEYDYSPVLRLRGGLAYEISPISDPASRIAQLPDADRIWLSFGATYKWSETTSLDFAYSHIFVDDARIQQSVVRNFGLAGNQPVTLNADSEASVDIISASLKVKLGGRPALPSLK